MSTSQTVSRSINNLHIKESHTTWGFVLYRCTYTDQQPWARLIATTRYTRETLGLDPHNILSKFTLITIEDSSILNNATVDIVRGHFKTWLKEAIDREQPHTRGGVRAEWQDNGDKGIHLPVRRGTGSVSGSVNMFWIHLMERMRINLLI